IFGDQDDRLVSDDSDLITISNKLRLVSLNGEGKEEEKRKEGKNSELEKSDEEFARMLQVLC
ncbi:unnamed protein product, partial [Ilex paraguariensis]